MSHTQRYTLHFRWEKYKWLSNSVTSITATIFVALLEKEPKLDVIVFNEAFTGLCWSNITLKNLLAYYGFYYSTLTVGDMPERKRRRRRFIGLVNGGVFIASKWPLLNTKSHVFRAYTASEADAWSMKGVVYTQVNKTGRIFHVLGTHLQVLCNPHKYE